VVQVSLLVQNLSVAASALILLLILSVHLSDVLFIIAVILVIVFACLSDLGGIATKVAIENDWVIVISGSDKSILAGNV
jgi:iron-regulated transporter 1